MYLRVALTITKFVVDFVPKEMIRNLLYKMYIIVFIYHLSINGIIVLTNSNTLCFDINILEFDINDLRYMYITVVVIIDTFVIIDIKNLCCFVAS